MTDTKFTPGPWAWDGDILTAGKSRRHLLYMEEAPGLRNEAAANAHLISAAPELYEASAPFDELATQRAVHSPEWRDSDTITVVVSIRALRAIKAARAKARGEA